MRQKALYPNHVWTYDFLFDQTADGRGLKLLPVVDEFTRECLTLEVARRMGAQDVIGVLEELSAVRGAPRYLRSDNGPEFVARRIQASLAQRPSSIVWSTITLPRTVRWGTGSRQRSRRRVFLRLRLRNTRQEMSLALSQHLVHNPGAAQNRGGSG